MFILVKILKIITSILNSATNTINSSETLNQLEKDIEFYEQSNK